MFGRKENNGTKVRGTRNATLKRGEEVVVDINDPYWVNQLAAGNIRIIDSEPVIEAKPDEKVYDADDFLEELERELGDG